MEEFLAAIDPNILLWLVLMIVFIVGELITVGLTSIWFAAGALAALIVACFGGGLPLQVGVFFVVSILLLAATRPWATKYINSRTQKTNVESLIGEEVRILERVSNIDQTGLANIHGQEWTVRTNDDKEVIEQGGLARVIRISGVKLIVEKVVEEKVNIKK